MKRAVSILLSFCVLAVSFFTLLFQNATAVGETNRFEAADQWKLFANSSEYVNESGIPAAAWAKLTENTNGAYTYGGGEKSIQIYARAQKSVFSFSVQKNRDYELSFQYYSDTLNSAGTYIVSSAGVLLPDGSTAWGKDGFLSYVASSIAYTAKDGVFADKITTTQRTLTSESGKWHTISLPFHSGENETLSLVITSAVDKLYLDDITLVDMSAGDGTVFDSADNWKLFANSSQYVNESGTPAAAWAKLTENTDNAYTYGEGGTSLKMSAVAQRAACVFPVEKNTDYVLTYRYYSDTLNSAGTYMISNTGVVLPDGNVSGSQDGYLSFIGSNAAYTTSDGVYENRTANASRTACTTTGEWNTVTIGFRSGDQEQLVFTLLSAVNTLYLDDFRLEKKETEPTFSWDDATAWKLFANSSQYVNESGTPAAAWAKLTENTDNAYTYGEGGTSLKMSAVAQRAACVFPVEKNTDYVLTYRYYSDTLNSAGTYMISSTGVVLPDGNVSGTKDGYLSFIGSNSAYTTSDGIYEKRTSNAGRTACTTTGEWNTVTIGFRTGDQEQLVFTLLSAVNTLYLDDFQLEKGTYDPGNDKPSIGQPQKITVIDFDSDGEVYLAQADRMDIVTAAGYDGKTSKMLHLKGGEYTSATFLNYNTTTTDSDPLFTLPVKEDTVYNLSWRIKMSADGPQSDWFAFYTYYEGKFVNRGRVDAARKGEWLYYETVVITEPGQDRISFTFNAGKTTPESWIDDITLTERDERPFAGWGDEPQQQYTINFDDFVVPFDQSDRMKVEKAPAREGVSSNALHILGGEYSTATFLNYNKTTTDSDPVFTLPVRENTLYRWSVWMYVPKSVSRVSYFAFYVDYQTTRIVRANGMTKRDQWVKYETTFVTQPGQTKISMTFNGAKSTPEAWLDDFTLQEVPAGTLSSTTAGYCEEFYNVLQEAGMVSAACGANTQVLQIPVEPMQQYTFGITVKSAVSSSSRVFLSFDGETVMPGSDTSAPSPVISADGKTARCAFDFISDSAPFVYLVIQNDDGALQIETPQLFKTYSMSTLLPMGYEENPNGAFATPATVEELAVVGGKNDPASGNPETGAAPLWPTLLLFTTLAAAVGLLLCFRKDGARG